MTFKTIVYTPTILQNRYSCMRLVRLPHWLSLAWSLVECRSQSEWHLDWDFPTSFACHWWSPHLFSLGAFASEMWNTGRHHCFSTCCWHFGPEPCSLVSSQESPLDPRFPCQWIQEWACDHQRPLHRASRIKEAFQWIHRTAWFWTKVSTTRGKTMRAPCIPHFGSESPQGKQMGASSMTWKRRGKISVKMPFGMRSTFNQRSCKR